MCEILKIGSQKKVMNQLSSEDDHLVVMETLERQEINQHIMTDFDNTSSQEFYSKLRKRTDVLPDEIIYMYIYSEGQNYRINSFFQE